MNRRFIVMYKEGPDVWHMRLRYALDEDSEIKWQNREERKRGMNVTKEKERNTRVTHFDIGEK